MSWLLKKINRLQDLAVDLWIFAATVFFCFIFFSFFFWFGFCFLVFFLAAMAPFRLLIRLDRFDFKKKTALFIVHKIVKKKSPPKKITRSLLVLHKSAHGKSSNKKKERRSKKKKNSSGPPRFLNTTKITEFETRSTRERDEKKNEKKK